MEERAPFETLPWPVRTDRLLIRPLSPDDVPALYAIRAQPEVSRWMTAAPDDYDEFARAFSEPGRTHTTLVVDQDGVVVGDLYLAVSDAWGQREVADRTTRTQAEIGWSVDPAYAGRGYATEGAAALLKICFDGLGLRRATAGAFADNLASIRVMEKIGMTIEGAQPARLVAPRPGLGGRGLRRDPRGGLARAPLTAKPGCLRAGAPPGWRL